jgi:hypothetical protein
MLTVGDVVAFTLITILFVLFLIFAFIKVVDPAYWQNCGDGIRRWCLCCKKQVQINQFKQYESRE